jgi:hypothetical protein
VTLNQERDMTIEPNDSIVAGLNQLIGILADAAKLLLTMKLLIADRAKPARKVPDTEDDDALMRLKDDGCPNGD